MRTLFMILLVISISTPAMSQTACILDQAPTTDKWGLYCRGKMPAPAVVRIELLVTPAAGGAVPQPGAQFDVNVPAGPVTAWCPPIINAVSARPETVPGPYIGPPYTPYWYGRKFNAAPGTRYAYRAISTTAPPLPPIPTMPPLLLADSIWPAAPGQLPWNFPRINYDYTTPAAQLGIMGGHWMAMPPNKSVDSSSSDDPQICATPTTGRGGTGEYNIPSNADLVTQ